MTCIDKLFKEPTSNRKCRQHNWIISAHKLGKFSSALAKEVLRKCCQHNSNILSQQVRGSASSIGGEKRKCYPHWSNISKRTGDGKGPPTFRGNII